MIYSDEDKIDDRIRVKRSTLSNQIGVPTHSYLECTYHENLKFIGDLVNQ